MSHLPILPKAEQKMHFSVSNKNLSQWRSLEAYIGDTFVSVPTPVK